MDDGYCQMLSSESKTLIEDHSLDNLDFSPDLDPDKEIDKFFVPLVTCL